MLKSITSLAIAIATTVGLNGLSLACARERPQPDSTEPYTEQAVEDGGWSPACIDEQLMGVARFAANVIQDGQLQHISMAEQQVVSGMNYAMVLEMDNGHRWEILVYHGLDDVCVLKHKVRLS